MTILRYVCGAIRRDLCVQVLLRALRDFNLGKLTSDDTSIFLGLLNDLFPKTLELVPRAVEKEFEAKVGRNPFGYGWRGHAASQPACCSTPIAESTNC